jgi:hypothetical protein
MAEKPKAKRRATPKLTDKAQSERFKETARQLGIEENQDFDRLVKKIAPSKKRM